MRDCVVIGEKSAAACSVQHTGVKLNLKVNSINGRWKGEEDKRTWVDMVSLDYFIFLLYILGCSICNGRYFAMFFGWRI